MMGSAWRRSGPWGWFLALLASLGLGPTWDIPARVQAQSPDEMAQASYLRWGCAGCHGAVWLGLPPATAPGLEGLRGSRSVAWFAGYLAGDTVRGGVRHPVPFPGGTAVADTLARWLAGGGAPGLAVEEPSLDPGPGASVGSERVAVDFPADPLDWTGARSEVEAWRTPAAAVAVVALLGVLLLAVRPAPALAPGGWALTALLLLLLPVLAFGLGAGHHLEQSRSTEFCLSCHIMDSWGGSLTGAVGTPAALAAIHFQGRLIPRDQACYTCHTQYTMYGGLQSKALGVRHLMVNAVGGAPDTLRLYTPYVNRECLHCHTGAEGFEGVGVHRALGPGGDREGTSCLTCHGPAHGLGGVP